MAGIRKASEVEIGESLPGRTVHIERATLVQYAGASLDRNPIHWDERFARKVGLPDVIAHGMFTMGSAVTAVTEWVGDAGRVVEYSVRFTKPVVVPYEGGADVVVEGVVKAVDAEAHTATVEPRKTLADFLREDLRLTGTHLGCEHGVCGACTVMVDGRAVRSCLVFAVQADGAEVTTVEGLAPDGELNPVQAAFRTEHGLQCGFCTPGFVVSATALLARNPDPTDDEIREGLSGNLCRCTGYQGILRAVRSAGRCRVVRGRPPIRHRGPARNGTEMATMATTDRYG